jgi:hypothetical protein
MSKKVATIIVNNYILQVIIRTVQCFRRLSICIGVRSEGMPCNKENVEYASNICSAQLDRRKNYDEEKGKNTR